MATNKTLTVLTPNGRRQNIKVTPNTTILQILEEVCNKHGFKSNEYDVKHHNKVLDTTSLVQFTGLPNNALLEMTPAIKTRSESTVTLCVQLENGERLMGDFTPSQSLWNVLLAVCPSEIESNDLVIIYMRREMYGASTLKETTLRQLGLTGGRAVIRLVHRKPEDLKVQANVSAPLPSKPVEEKPYKRTLIKLDSPTNQESVINENPMTFSIDKKPKTDDNESMSKISTVNEEIASKLSIDKQSTNDNSTESIVTNNSNENDEIMPLKPKEDIVFLGARDALLFKLAMSQGINQLNELPDEFFDLTVNDARTLLADIKRQRAEIEEMPLQTEQMRNLNRDKRILRNLGKYKRTVIRIHFPDRTVLQGTFRSTETIDDVVQFVKEYLDVPNLQFYLYTTPPKRILNVTDRLIEADCVPCAVLHFGVHNTDQLSVNHCYIRSEFIDKFTSYSLASLAATQSRGITENQSIGHVPVTDNNMDGDISYPSSSSGAVPKQTRQPQTFTNTNNTGSNKKIPKWFKPI